MALHGHNLFFASRVENHVAYLDREESRHATSVLRLSSGDPIQITDGRGAVYECRIKPGSSGALCAEIISTKQVPKPRCPVSIFVGMGYRERFEELAENCAALGADRIVPLVCRFCQKPWWSEWERHAQRINKKMVAGIKQSCNPWLPQCPEPTLFEDAVSKQEPSFVIAADASGSWCVDIFDKIKQSPAVSCFVGPPGGFSPQELDMLEKKGAAFVSLSANRLRTELAAVLLCGVIKTAASG
jgi:16S rRNA (uracil1498-N3)-methyltransferase